MRLPFVGEVVVAMRDGGHDNDGFPRERPLAGRTYRVTGIYEMPYGYGCTLDGMDPFPYQGYFLFRKGRKDGKFSKLAGWYFKPMEVAEEWFSEFLYRMDSNEDEPIRITLEGEPDDPLD